MSAVDSLADHYKQSGYSDFPQEHLAPGALGVDLLRVRQGAILETDPAIRQIAFAVCTDVSPDYRGRWNCGDGWHSLDGIRKNEILPGCSNLEATFEFEGSHELVIMAIPTPVLARAFEIDEKVIDEVQVCTFRHRLSDAQSRRHATAAGMINVVWGEAESQSAHAGLLLDSAAVAVSALLIGHAFPNKADAIPKLGDLRLARAIDYIETNIGTPLRLDDIAAVAGISSYHFTRAFKASTGLTVHNYVLLRRIRRAKNLLSTSSQPLVQVAFEAGFASQSHMTDVFRSRVGVTPARFRCEQNT